MLNNVKGQHSPFPRHAAVALVAISAILAAAAVRPAEASDLVVPPLTRPVTLADLAGEWSTEGGMTSTYADRPYSGGSGTDAFQYRDTKTITAEGVITDHYVAIRNGKQIVEDTAGVIKVIDGRILDIKLPGNSGLWVVRGWLDLPSMTIITVAGPFYGEIPQRIFDDPKYGTNLQKNWVRKEVAAQP